MPDNMLWEGFKALLPTGPVVIGGGLAWHRFMKERPHEARINFTVDAQVIATNDQHHIVDCVLTFENRGITRIKVNTLSLQMRGVTEKSAWEYWKGHGNRLHFPHKIFKEDNIIPTDWGYIFFWSERCAGISVHDIHSSELQCRSGSR